MRRRRSRRSRSERAPSLGRRLRRSPGRAGTFKNLIRRPRVWLSLRHLDWLVDRMGSPILEGNEVKLLPTGRAVLDEMLGAIESAERSLAIEMYTWADDRLGRRFAEAAGRRALGGLPVRVLVDAFGSVTSVRLMTSLRGTGAQVLWYHPLLPWTPSWYPNRRNHRKLLIADGKVAFVSGLNLAESYTDEFHGQEAWRELGLRIEGPAVGELVRLFLGTWVRSGGELDRAEPSAGTGERRGPARVQVVGAHGLRGRRSLRRTYLTFIDLARERIFIANSYFAPETSLRRALARAARRGVRVELLLPGKSDVPMVRWAGRAFYGELLAAGVQVREMHHVILHAKAAVFDEKVLVTGSANLDYRSFRHNLELAVNVFHPDSAKKVLEALEADFARSAPVHLEQWRRRSALERLLEWLGALFRYWL